MGSLEHKKVPLMVMQACRTRPRVRARYLREFIKAYLRHAAARPAELRRAFTAAYKTDLAVANAVSLQLAILERGGVVSRVGAGRWVLSATNPGERLRLTKPDLHAALRVLCSSGRAKAGRAVDLGEVAAGMRVAPVRAWRPLRDLVRMGYADGHDKHWRATTAGRECLAARVDIFS